MIMIIILPSSCRIIHTRKEGIHLMKAVRLVLMYTVLFLLLFPTSAGAYSYGDPNKEDIAEALLVIQSKLDAPTADWDGAYQQYLAHKKVLNLEFGDNVTGLLDANFAAKDKKLLYANYQAMLVLNLKRRFDYADKNIQDYAQSKLLLAKAKGTFDVLMPYVKDKSTVDKVEASFQSALEALGNPGLFGVGKKESQPDVFRAETTAIYNTVRPLFPLQQAAAAPAPKPAPTPTPAPAPQTAQQPAATEAKAAPAVEPSKPAVSAPAAAPDKPAPVQADANAAPQTENAAQPAASEVGAEPKEADKPEQPAETSAAAAAEPVQSAAASEAGKTSAASEPAPLFNTNVAAESKVNTTVTATVIAFILLLVGGGVYFLKKKGYFRI